MLKDFTTTTEVRPAWDTLNKLNVAVDILSTLSLRKPAGCIRNAMDASSTLCCHTGYRS